MKSFDSRTYSVNDYREWDDGGQLVLSPRFQRRSVWTDTARSYLMDTIIRGKPIPKVFIRQRIDPSSGKSVREVVDGQQRLRTILSFVKDGFYIRRSHNSDFGGLYFSQLDEDDRLKVLSYEISTDLLINVSDTEVLDIFARLNSHAVVLNSQEKLNASHFGPFKQLADKVAHQYFEYWVSNGILRDAQVMRMADVELTADLLIAMCDGVQSKKQVGVYYRLFEEDFPHNTDELREEFERTMGSISEIFPEGLRDSELQRVHLFYTLFTAVYHLKFGMPEFSQASAGIFDSLTAARVRNAWSHVDEVFETEDDTRLTAEDRQFLTDSRRATTDASVRERRTQYLLGLALARR